MIKPYKVLIGLFLTVFVLLASCSREKSRLKPGDTAPLFDAPGADGNKVSLNHYAGKVILLHFWADWCTECRAEFPKLQNAYTNLNDQNFEIIAVNVGQSKEHVQSFIDNYHLTFPMILDENTRIARLYHIKGLPTNYFIKPDLTLYKIVIGWVNEKQIHKILLDLTGKDEK